MKHFTLGSSRLLRRTRTRTTPIPIPIPIRAIAAFLVLGCGSSCCQAFPLTQDSAQLRTLITTRLQRQHSPQRPHLHPPRCPPSFSSLSMSTISTGIDDNNENAPQPLSPSSSTTSTSTRTTGGTGGGISEAAQWHKNRRRQMIAKYGDELLALERSSSQWIGLPLLLLGNLTLMALAIWCGSLPLPAVLALAVFPGSILSLWQLQILHDALHGTLLDKQLPSTLQLGPFGKISKYDLQEAILFWGSMPSVFGYHLYLKRGHLTHHKNVGSQSATLEKLFDSSQSDFEDGDVLFVSHRMNLKGPIGPQFPLPDIIQSVLGAPAPETIRMSISRSGFHVWKEGEAYWNAAIFCTSFLIERYALCWNDVVVAATGRNFFFPNKPTAFHDDCATYARSALVVRGSLFVLGGGWKGLLFLYFSESLWSLPPHPASAMFVTNHGSKQPAQAPAPQEGAAAIAATTEGCEPSSSTYAGAWYSWMTLGTNYHVEHHDFPSIPFHLLWKCRQIAPEFYRTPQRPDGQDAVNVNVWEVMKEAFAHPDFYACSDAGSLLRPQRDE